MKRYIEQLIEDLEVAQGEAVRRLGSYFRANESDGYELLFDDDEAGIKISELIGIEQFYFPKADYLDDIEANELVKSMENVYDVYGLIPIYDNQINNKTKYEHFRLNHDCMVYPAEGDVVDVEFCDYLP